MASVCHRSALRGSLRVAVLLLLGAPPSLAKRDHLIVEPGPNESRSVSEIVSAATEQTLAPLRQARAGLQARMQELDAKMAKLREEQDALQEEAQRQDERVSTLEEMKQRYNDLLDKARDGMRALERNYTSNTEEAGRILRCLDGGCGKVAGNGTVDDGETDVMNQQKELEAGLLGPAPDEAHPDGGVPDVSAEEKEAIGQLDAQLKADGAAEKDEGFIEKVKDFFEDHFIGDEDEKTIGEPVHEDGTPLAAGENATNTTNTRSATAAAEAAGEANGTEEGTVPAGPGDGGSTSAEPAEETPLEANETEVVDELLSGSKPPAEETEEKGGSTSAVPVEANETEVVDELLSGSKAPAEEAEGKGGSTSASPVEANETEEPPEELKESTISTSAGPEEGGSTSSAPVEANETEESPIDKVKDFFEDHFFGDEDEKTIGEPVHEDGTPLAAGENPTKTTNATNETEESPYDHADDAHELDPDCQDAFMKLPAAIRQHSVGFAKGKGDCKNRAMVLETAPGSEDGGSTSAEPAEAKGAEESTTSTSARPGEGGSTSAAPVEALNQSKPREGPVDARGRPVEVQHHDATESTVSAGSEEGIAEEEEEEEEDSATKEIAISTGFEGDSSTSAAPGKAGAAGKSTDPLDTDDFSSEENTASVFAPPSAESVADEEDACTEVRYSWKSVRPSATVCLPEDAPMTALLAAVCSEQLGPAGYDISKCSAEPYVRCQGKSEQGKWYSVDQKVAAQATVGAELQNDFAHGHFTCENRVRV